MPNTNVFTGADGTITLAPLDTPPGSDAESVLVTYELQQAVGRVTGIRVAVDTDLREFFQIGNRSVQSLHEGDIHVRGEIDRAYINGALLGLLLGRKAYLDFGAQSFQPEFNITMDLNDPAVPGLARLDIGGVKFQNWSLCLPEDDIVMEQVTFRAKTIQIADFDDDSGVAAGPAFID